MRKTMPLLASEARRPRLPGMVESYRSNHQPAARPWIPGTGQSMSPGLGAIFSRVTSEHKTGPKLQHIVFSQKQAEGDGHEAPWASFRELGSKRKISSLFKFNFLTSFFFIFAPECGIIAYKFNSVSKICFKGGSA